VSRGSYNKTPSGAEEHVSRGARKPAGPTPPDPTERRHTLDELWQMKGRRALVAVNNDAVSVAVLGVDVKTGWFKGLDTEIGDSMKLDPTERVWVFKRLV